MKERIFLVSIIMLLVIGIVGIISIYESKILESQSYVVGGKKVKLSYTAKEIRALIKTMPEYRGDSITIYENGYLTSADKEFNAGLVYNQVDNTAKSRMEAKAKSEYMPVAYIVYREVAIYDAQIKKSKMMQK